MKAFVVIIQNPEPRTFDKLSERYESANVYRVNKLTSLVRTKQLAEDVAITAGIKGKNRFVSGVVFKISQSYAGFGARSLWDWLRENEK